MRDDAIAIVKEGTTRRPTPLANDYSTTVVVVLASVQAQHTYRSFSLALMMISLDPEGTTLVYRSEAIVARMPDKLLTRSLSPMVPVG
jgi:hypothetical protein